MSEAARLERETEQTRAELETTLDELRSRITPGQMVDQLMERARDGNAGAFVRNFGQQVAANPIPVAVIGVGLAWLMMANKQPQQQASSRGDRARSGGYGGTAEYVTGEHVADAGYAGEAEYSDADYPGGNGRARLELRGDPSGRFSDMAHNAAERLGESAQAAGDAAHGVADQTRAKLGQAASSVKGSLQHSAASAGETAKRAAAALQHSASEAGMMTRRLVGFCKEQPLILAGLGLALGAALGAAFPATRTEDELVGDASDDVKRRAASLADRVSATASSTLDGAGGERGTAADYDSQADFAAGAGAGSDLPDPTADPDAMDAEWPGGVRPSPNSGAPLHSRGAE